MSSFFINEQDTQPIYDEADIQQQLNNPQPTPNTEPSTRTAGAIFRFGSDPQPTAITQPTQSFNNTSVGSQFSWSRPLTSLGGNNQEQMVSSDTNISYDNIRNLDNEDNLGVPESFDFNQQDTITPSQAPTSQLTDAVIKPNKPKEQLSAFQGSVKLSSFYLEESKRLMNRNNLANMRQRCIDNRTDRPSWANVMSQVVVIDNEEHYHKRLVNQKWITTNVKSRMAQLRMLGVLDDDELKSRMGNSKSNLSMAIPLTEHSMNKIDPIVDELINTIEVMDQIRGLMSHMCYVSMSSSNFGSASETSLFGSSNSLLDHCPAMGCEMDVKQRVEYDTFRTKKSARLFMADTAVPVTPSSNPLLQFLVSGFCAKNNLKQCCIRFFRFHTTNPTLARKRMIELVEKNAPNDRGIELYEFSVLQDTIDHYFLSETPQLHCIADSGQGYEATPFSMAQTGIVEERLRHFILSMVASAYGNYPNLSSCIKTKSSYVEFL